MKKNIDAIGNIYYTSYYGGYVHYYDEDGNPYNPIETIADYMAQGFSLMEAYAVRMTDYLFNMDDCEGYYEELIKKLEI